MITSLYERIRNDLRKDGHKYNGMLELCGHYVRTDHIALDMLQPLYIPNFTQYLRSNGYPLDHRLNMEVNHYNKLKYTLFHSVAENFFYTKDDVMYTRRAIALSTDCISCIQAKIVDRILNLHVFMRSSHVDNLLPVDLLFLFGLPAEFIDTMLGVSDTFNTGWEEHLQNLSHMTLSIMFGSLHTDV